MLWLWLRVINWLVLHCMHDTFARATHSAYAAARPSARATIGYLVYKVLQRPGELKKADFLITSDMNGLLFVLVHLLHVYENLYIFEILIHFYPNSKFSSKTGKN